MSSDETRFDQMQANDQRAERRILIGEIVLLVVITLASVLYAHLVA
jgi:hypothetical protein